ncbi:MAG: sialate O-acetylesterase [Akkermansiaceae bacterium]|nr:sialate O-acetylesterase [Akkermansiaceae bacterium]
MNHRYIRLCGLAAMALTLTASAQPQILLDLPLDWQVIQRNAQEWAEVKVAGTVPAGVTVVEASAEPGAGLRGKVIDWTMVAQGAQIKDRKSAGSLRLAAGGWYTLKERFRKSTTGLVAALDGKHWQLANDPQPGASGDAGSFRPPFGDAIATKFNVPVGIIACGIGATSVREWRPKGTTFPNPPTLEGRVRQFPSGEWESKGEAFEMFAARMKHLGYQGFRAVLWHQGESDAEQPDPKRTLIGEPYRQYLERLIRESRREIGWDASWFVALVSSHGGEGVPEMRDAQKSLWDDGIALEGGHGRHDQRPESGKTMSAFRAWVTLIVPSPRSVHLNP